MELADDLNAWAAAVRMLKAGMRPPVVHLATGLPKSRLRNLYQEIHGQSAPRGRVPENAARQIKNMAQAIEAMLFVRVYLNTAMDRLASENGLDSNLVMDAYRIYARTVAGDTLDVSLAWFLARDLRDGVIQIRRCQQCNSEYLHEPQSPFLRTCPLCRMRSH